MLGLGGSGLYIPILYWMGLEFKTEAIPLGMLCGENVILDRDVAILFLFDKWR